MTHSARRRVPLACIAIVLTLSFAVQASAQGEACRGVLEKLGEALIRGSHALEGLGGEREIPGLSDLAATVERLKSCGPCGPPGIRPMRAGLLHVHTFAACIGTPVYLDLWLHESADGCEIQSIEHELDMEEVRLFLRAQKLERYLRHTTDCVHEEARGPVMVGGDVKAPVRIHDPRPQYTHEAKKARIQGIVIVQATIDKEGIVTDTRILKGLPMGLNEMAESAVRQWKFRPATLKGEPVAVYYNLTINFSLRK